MPGFVRYGHINFIDDANKLSEAIILYAWLNIYDVIITLIKGCAYLGEWSIIPGEGGSCLLADTQAAHSIGGFKVGVGFAFRKCRDCLATKEMMSTMVIYTSYYCNILTPF